MVKQKRMNYLLFDDNREQLLPLTFTRPVADIRAGILTIREKWEKYLNSETSTITENYLRKKYSFVIEEDNLLINGSVFPNEELVKELLSLEINQKLVSDETMIAARIGEELLTEALDENYPLEKLDVLKVRSECELMKISRAWDIFLMNGNAITQDFNLLTNGRKSAAISDSNTVIGNSFFAEEGAKAECAIFNTETGPIYLGRNSEVMEGALIRGPFSLGEGAVLKMGAKIYGPSTIGPYCKVGGEVNNSVIFGYSNKAHDGFIGNSVIGEWCNLGADTNTSNLKNNYSEVKVWDYPENDYLPTGLQFCGLIMGDHSKCGINTMFNTGTVVGVSANVFGSDFPPKFIPSFAWGGATGFTSFEINKALELAEKVLERRNIAFDDKEKDILQHIFDQTATYRQW